MKKVKIWVAELVWKLQVRFTTKELPLMYEEMNRVCKWSFRTLLDEE